LIAGDAATKQLVARILLQFPVLIIRRVEQTHAYKPIANQYTPL